MLIELADVELKLAHEQSIAERRFDEALAVVEVSFDLDRSHIVAPAGELPLLERGHATFRIEDDCLDPDPAFRRAADRATGVAGGCGKHR